MPSTAARVRRSALPPAAGSGVSSGSGSAIDGTRRRSWASSSRHSAPGIASTANPGQYAPVTASAPAIRSGPANAPTWSRALCTANPRPRPVAVAIRARSADFAGLRIALPVRSSRIRTDARATPAAPTNGAIARSGTQTAVIA